MLGHARCDIRSSDAWRGRPLPLKARTDSSVKQKRALLKNNPFSTSFPTSSQNSSCTTHNLLLFHHIPLSTVAALPGWEKRPNAATVGNKNGSTAMTTKCLAFPDKEGTMPAGCSLLPAQAPNPQEKDRPASLTNLARQLREKDSRHCSLHTPHQKTRQRWIPRPRSKRRSRCPNQGFSSSHTSTCLLNQETSYLLTKKYFRHHLLRSIPLEARARINEPKLQNHHSLVAASSASLCSRHSNAFAKAAVGLFGWTTSLSGFGLSFEFLFGDLGSYHRGKKIAKLILFHFKLICAS